MILAVNEVQGEGINSIDRNDVLLIGVRIQDMCEWSYRGKSNMNIGRIDVWAECNCKTGMRGRKIKFT